MSDKSDARFSFCHSNGCALSQKLHTSPVAPLGAYWYPVLTYYTTWYVTTQWYTFTAWSLVMVGPIVSVDTQGDAKLTFVSWYTGEAETLGARARVTFDEKGPHPADQSGFVRFDGVKDGGMFRVTDVTFRNTNPGPDGIYDSISVSGTTVPLKDNGSIDLSDPSVRERLGHLVEEAWPEAARKHFRLDPNIAASAKPIVKMAEKVTAVATSDEVVAPSDASESTLTQIRNTAEHRFMIQRANAQSSEPVATTGTNGLATAADGNKAAKPDKAQQRQQLPVDDKSTSTGVLPPLKARLTRDNSDISL